MNSTTDLREQLYNDRFTGPAYDISLSVERITKLHGILFDLDPSLLVANNSFFPPAEKPGDFYAAIRPVLDRHPLACSAEVRCSGRGLHLILWLEPAVELTTEAEQQRWDMIVRAVQCSLPADPAAPAMTALTRPVGFTNSRNGAKVEILKPGKAVEPEAVEAFVEQLAQASFKTIASVLFGQEHITPCPVCKRPGSRLDVLDRIGNCYEGCSKVTLAEIYDIVFKPVEVVSATSEAREQVAEENQDSTKAEENQDSTKNELILPMCQPVSEQPTCPETTVAASEECDCYGTAA